MKNRRSWHSASKAKWKEAAGASLDQKEVTRRRIGAAAARQRFTPVATSSQQPALSLEVRRSTTPQSMCSSLMNYSACLSVDPG
jgi:hypothetical protein